MDLFKKYFNNNSMFALVSDSIVYHFKCINEKPISFILAPMTLILFCYYVYIYVRKFYPITVNCWFCNTNFKVAFEDRFEFTCISCGQFNGFKEDGSYSKIIPEQHDQWFNQTAFSVVQNDVNESKNGLCHKCNIIQEIKIKQLASFVPSNEKSFDIEVEKFRENLEATLKLCYKCNQYTKKILSLQEQRYNLKPIDISQRVDTEIASDWPNILSLCLSVVVGVLSAIVENYFGKWTSINASNYDSIVLSRSIGMASLGGILCQVYQCLSTMDKLSAVLMLLWSSLFSINNFEIVKNFESRLLVSVFIVLLSLISILRMLKKKHTIRPTITKLEDKKYQFSNKYCDISANGSVKNSDESEMMDVDWDEDSPKRVKKTSNNAVNHLFSGLKLNENRGRKNNIIRPQKFFPATKRDKIPEYAESSPGYYSPYSTKENYDFDTRSVCSQQSYRSQCPSLCHQAVSPYGYYAQPIHHQPSHLNLSNVSNTSNGQPHSVEWPKMLIYSIPGIVLLALQCYLLYDIKDFMKQK